MKLASTNVRMFNAICALFVISLAFRAYAQPISQENLPPDFVLPAVEIKSKPAPGYYFLGYIASSSSETIGQYAFVLDSNFNAVAYKRVGDAGGRMPINVMQAPTGLITHWERLKGAGPDSQAPGVYVSDTAFTAIDSIPNVGESDMQGVFEACANGNYLLIQLKDVAPRDFSLDFEGGEPNGKLTSSNVVEYDAEKNIVFYWRSVDHIPIENSYANLKQPSIAFTHFNKATLDRDGALLVSCKPLSSILKIDRLSGDIVWTLGGKGNDFQFVGEHEENAPTYFSSQHDPTRLANGNLMIFDNGSQHKPQYSRCVEYALDEENMVAEMVWEYRRSPDVYGKGNGSCQRFDNGSTLVGWGDASTEGGPGATEIDSEGETVFEMNFPLGFKSFRALKYPYIISIPKANVRKEIMEKNTYDFSDNYATTGVSMKINSLEEIFYSFVRVKKFDFSPTNQRFAESVPPNVWQARWAITMTGINSIEYEIRFNAETLGINYMPENYSIYRRAQIGSGVFERLETSYNPETKEIMATATEFGEFLLGVAQPETAPDAPILIAPENGRRIAENQSIKLRWAPRGYFTKCYLAISENPDMSDPIVDISQRGFIEYDFSEIESGKKYYWQVFSSRGASIGEKSEIREFEPAAPFIEITYPNGGETLMKNDERKIIRWMKNIDDIVRIELYKNGELVSVIADSLKCQTGASAWVVPEEVEIGTDYKIRVSSVSSPDIYGESADYFAVDGQSGVEWSSEIESELNVAVAPNPFEETVVFSFEAFRAAPAQAAVFDALGSVVAVFRIEGGLETKELRVAWTPENLSPGVYYCKIFSSGKTGFCKFIKL